MDFDTLVKQSENDQQEITKPAMPSLSGIRRPVLITIGDYRTPFFGHIVEGTAIIKLVHDYKIIGMSVTHVATLVPTDEENTFAVKSEFVHVKQRPSLGLRFSGTLRRDKDGYSGALTISYPGHESTDPWTVEYDE